MLTYSRAVLVALLFSPFVGNTLLARADSEESMTPAELSNEVNFASIQQLQTAMEAGSLSSLQVLEAHLARIDMLDQRGPALNAIAHRADELARTQARALDAEREAQGPRSLLHGIPVVIKDNYETVGLPTTAGSASFARGPAPFAPPRDAELVRRLREAGAVIVGKATMHEFAYGITTQGSSFGQTRNAYDLTRNPGGSSGGTGVAVAAGMATVGMGSDTCGSIRIPAAQNNLVGLRGTQGLSSRRGIIPLSSTQDIGGPLARSVRDLSIVLDATVGFDPQDPQTQVMQERTAPKYLASLRSLDSAKVGLLKDWVRQEAADEPVAVLIRDALAHMQTAANWRVPVLESPQVNASLNDRPWNGHVVLIRDFAFDVDRYLGANPQLQIANLGALHALGLHHPSIAASLAGSIELAQPQYADLYQQELEQRDVVRRALVSMLDQHGLDALAYPTIRQVAAPLGAEQGGTNCRLSAISGLPAISVPAGFTAEGLPVGIEFLGRAFDEQTLLNLALGIEQHLAARRVPSYSDAQP